MLDFDGVLHIGRIWKIGDKIRLDSTLLDVSEGAVSTKGQHTFIIAVNEDGGLVSTAVDHGDKSYVRKVVFDAAKDKEKEERSEEEKAEDLEHELNAMMASEIVEANLRPQDLVFTRALSGYVEATVRERTHPPTHRHYATHARTDTDGAAAYIYLTC